MNDAKLQLPPNFKIIYSPLCREEEHDDTSDPWVLVSTWILSPIILRMSEYLDLGRYDWNKYPLHIGGTIILCMFFCTIYKVSPSETYKYINWQNHRY